MPTPVLHTLDDVARMLHRKPGALRTAMSIGSDVFAQRLKATRIKIGKRVYWREETIDSLINEAAERARI